ncbi:MAG: ankyrin repeat domain-containing protein [Gemmataceae bacterium]
MPKRSTPAKPNRREARKELLTAIQAVDLPGVKRLLAADPELVNAANAHHNVPLGDALATGNVELVQLLLDLGADAKHRNHGGHSLLDGAAFAGQPALARLLIEHGAEPTVHHAAALGDLALLRQLIEADARLLEPTPAGGRWRMTPLHAAARAANLESVRYLLSAGAKVDALDHNEHTPLALVVENPEAAAALEVAAVLLDHGADMNDEAGHHGGGLLHRAVMKGHLELARLLLERGADPNRTDLSGKAPLHYAVEKNKALVALLLEFGPDLTTENLEGETPVALARRKRRQAIVALLEGT